MALGCLGLTAAVYSTALNPGFPLLLASAPGAVFAGVRLLFGARRYYHYGIASAGELYLATFPDIYRRSEPSDRAAKRLSAIGASEGLGNPALTTKAKMTLGLAVNVSQASTQASTYNEAGGRTFASPQLR